MSDLKYRGVDMCALETHDEPWEMYDYLRENDPIYWDEHNEVWYALLRRFETVALKAGGRHEWASSSFTRGPKHMDLVFD
jgi:hypothetical protein